MVDYKKLYEDLVDRVKKMAKAQPLVTKKAIEMYFPEIVESEDERIRKELIGFCNSCATGQTSILVKDSSQWKRWIDWLENKGEQKSQRIVSAEAKEALYDKPAWGEEDERMLNSFLHKVEVCDLLTNKEIRWIKNKFKALRPQNHWKPSEEQIKAVRLARSFVTDDFDENPTLSDVLVELEKQLKKLREE